MNIKKQLINGLMGVGVIKLFSLPIGLLTSIILARILGPESFGQYAFVMALIPIISLPVAGGIQQLITREVSVYRNKQEWSRYNGLVNSFHAWIIAISILAIGTVYASSYLMNLSNASEKWSILLIAIFLMPLIGFSAARTGIIKGLGRPVLSELPQQLVTPLLILIFVVGLSKFKILNVENAIWANISAAFLSFLFASFVLKLSQPDEIKNSKPLYEFHGWFKSLLPFTVLAAVNLVNVQVGILILGFLSSDEQVAALRIAERGSQLVLLSLTVVNMVVAPYFVDAYKQKDYLNLQDISQKTAKIAFFVALPIACVFIFLGQPLLGFVFGSEYTASSYLPLIILSLAQLVNIFFGSVGFLLVMTGHENDSLKGQFVALLINFSLAILLVPAWGAMGASIAIFVSIFVWNFLLIMLVKKRLGIRCSAF